MNEDTLVEGQEQSRLVSTAYVVLGVILAIGIGVGLIIGILWLARSYPQQIEAIRDVFIIALAIETCLFGMVLILTSIMLIRLVNTVEFEIKPILRQTNETIGAIRGTTKFVSKNVVSPVAKAGGFLVGIRRGFKVLFGDPRKNLPD